MGGRQVGIPQGGRVSQWSHGGAHLNYNFRAVDVAVTRRLYHSGLDAIVDYPRLPEETTFFSWDIHPRRDFARQKTLSSHVTTVWPAVVDDIIIKEKFRATGGMAIQWRFFQAVHRLWLTDPDWNAGEYLLWRPFDRTFKLYPVDIINILLDGEELNPSYDGDDKWAGIMSRIASNSVTTSGKDVATVKELEIWLQLRPEAAPNSSMFLVEGSETSEEDVFDPE